MSTNIRKVSILAFVFSTGFMVGVNSVIQIAKPGLQPGSVVLFAVSALAMFIALRWGIE